MSVYELKLAKMATKKAEIRPGATERPYDRTAAKRPPKKNQPKSIDSCSVLRKNAILKNGQKSADFCCKQAEKIAKFYVTLFSSTSTPVYNTILGFWISTFFFPLDAALQICPFCYIQNGVSVNYKNYTVNSRRMN